MPSKYSTEIFIEKAKNVHKNKYDYKLVEYINSKLKVNIICPIHGVFEQQPNNHINNKGCAKCSGNVRYTIKEFIKKANKIHSNKYDYPNGKYVNNSTEVVIICGVHGNFNQKPATHLLGHGCRKCAEDNKRKYPLSLIGTITRTRNCIFSSYKRKGFTKRSNTSILLGCSWEDFKVHLEDNSYGFKITDKGLDLDHIIPISSANTEKDIYKLNHYTNFQLLPSEYNRWIKSCKLFNKYHFEEWLESNKLKK